ncbi:coiled-coil domain-containing protein 43-like [Babylonia areolata]|uniref:coiled-coil domain-containing protein 43-like n=1 Tax=Babylonia areolata TaxID=304850 RepID=UPI003FD67EE7
MAAAMASYEDWLTEKLKSLSPEFDTDVFVSYIISILDTDSSADEVTESIEEILSQVLGGEGSGSACKEIVEEWGKHQSRSLAAANSAVKKDAGDMLCEIMEQQSLATVKENKRSAEEEARKQAILAQYAHVSDGEETDQEAEEASAFASSHKGKGESADTLMERNTNAASVMEAQQVQREQSKQEHERKKEKDKQDREAQRQKQQQRKEAEKKRTQKGERRR